MYAINQIWAVCCDRDTDVSIGPKPNRNVEKVRGVNGSGGRGSAANVVGVLFCRRHYRGERNRRVTTNREEEIRQKSIVNSVDVVPMIWL